MPKPDNLIDKRMANALFKGAKANAGSRMMLGINGRVGLKAVEKIMGGLWVGGNAWLTPEAIIFEPNMLNRGMHADAETLRVELALDTVTDVRWRKGIATSIIDITAGEEKLSLRCYNSRRFADAIRTAVKACQSA